MASIVEEMVDANPSALIDLYELDVRDLPDFDPFEFENYYDIIPAENKYVRTNWEVVSDVFYSPRFEDLTDWTLSIESGKSWNTINSDVNDYVGVGIDLPLSVGDYYLDSNTAQALMLSEYANGTYIDTTALSYYNYSDFFEQTGSYEAFDISGEQGITLEGNRWIAAPYSYTITEDTVIELEYENEVQGTIHAIGLDFSTITESPVVYLDNYGVWQPDTPSDYETNIYAVSPNAMAWDSTGNNLYISRKDTGKIYQYYTDTVYDITTLYHYSGYELDISNQDVHFTGICFANSGTYLYAAGFNTNKIFRYTLSTPYDIRTATHDQTYQASTEISTNSYNLQGLFINESGDDIYVTINSAVTIAENLIYQYTLGTSYDLSTISFYNKADQTADLPETQDVFFSPDGLNAYIPMYGTENPHIIQLSLSVAWDTDTMFNSGYWDMEDSYLEDAYKDTSPFEDKITSVCFDSTGKYMFIVGNRTDRVHKFSVRNNFNIDRNQEIDGSSTKIIQLSGYDDIGINYKIYDEDDSGYKKILIPVGQFYTGNMEYLFFGISTGETASIDAKTNYKNIAIYDKVSANTEEIFRTTKATFPPYVLITALEDRVIIFDITESNRQMWKVILDTDLDSENPPKIKFVDMASGSLYIGTDVGIYEYDFILDTIALIIESTTIVDLKSTMTIEGSLNTDRLNQPIPPLVYIDNGYLSIRKHINGSYVTITPYSGAPNNFNKIEISGSRELYAFTDSGKVYYFGLISDLYPEFTFKNAFDCFYEYQKDVMLNGIVNSEYNNIKLATKENLYAAISTTYNTGYYTEETYLECAAFENNAENVHNGVQILKNPDFLEGDMYYIYQYGWKYSNHSMVGTNAYSGFYQEVLVPSIEDYVVTVHVSDVQSGTLSLVVEPAQQNEADDNVIIQYIAEGSSDYIDTTKVRYIKALQDSTAQERDITGEGVFSFIIPVHSYNNSVIILGHNFTGTVNSVKMRKISDYLATNRISGNDSVKVYGEMKVSNLPDNSNMVKYQDGVFCTNIIGEEVYIYYWEFDGISWKFVYHEGYSSNKYDGIYYIDCTLPKALIRLSSIKYTDKQLSLIRANESLLFRANSNVLLEQQDNFGEPLTNIRSVSFDDRTSYYYTQMVGSNNLQKFKDLVCYDIITVHSGSNYLNANYNNITLNNIDSYDISYYGDGTASTSGGDAGVYRFYNGTNQYGNPIIWKGKAYSPWPIKVEGYETSGDKEIPRPTMSAANIGYILTDLVHKYEDLLGAKVSRKRTFAKFLDEINFIDGNPHADPTIEFPDTVFYINKKIAETYEMLTFELSSQWDVEGVKLPRRLVTYDTCYWKYRDGSCGYAGDKYFDIHGNPVNSITEDVCGKRLSDCLKRFSEEISDGDNNTITTIVSIPFGGFPGVGL
jgi:lambda family phage minor tail protein L